MLRVSASDSATSAQQGARASRPSRDLQAKLELMTMEQRWLLLAPSYELGERLDDFAHSHPEADQAGVADHLDPGERCAVLRVVGDTDNLEPASLCNYRG